MLNGMKIAGGMNLSDAFKLKLTAFEMDGMSAVISYNGATRLYTTTMLHSYLQMEYHLDKKSWLSVGVGNNFLRISSIKNAGWAASSSIRAMRRNAVFVLR